MLIHRDAKRPSQMRKFLRLKSLSILFGDYIAACMGMEIKFFIQIGFW